MFSCALPRVGKDRFTGNPLVPSKYASAAYSFGNRETKSVSISFIQNGNEKEAMFYKAERLRILQIPLRRSMRSKKREYALQPSFKVVFSIMMIVLVSASARSSSILMSGVPMMCLLRRSNSPIFLDASIKSAAFRSNHEISIVLSG